MNGIIELVTLQTSGSEIVGVSTGTAILYIGLFGAVTLLTMRLKSALAVLGWALTGVLLVFVLLDILPDTIYFMALSLAMLAIGTTAAYVATHA